MQTGGFTAGFLRRFAASNLSSRRLSSKRVASNTGTAAAKTIQSGDQSGAVGAPGASEAQVEIVALAAEAIAPMSRAASPGGSFSTAASAGATLVRLIFGPSAQTKFQRAETLLVKLQNCRVHDPIGKRLPRQRREASASVGDDPAAARERVEIFDDHAAVAQRPAIFEN